MEYTTILYSHYKLFGYPAAYSFSVTRNRKRTKGGLGPNRRRSRMTACRSDRHAFETLYVVNSGLYRRWSNKFGGRGQGGVSRRAHSFVWEGQGSLYCGIAGHRRSYSIALTSTCTGLLFIRSYDQSKVESKKLHRVQRSVGAWLDERPVHDVIHTRCNSRVVL